MKARMQTRNAARVAKFPGVIGTFMGRDALSLVVSSLDLDLRDTVLLPVYTCQEVLRSFVSKVDVAFYDVQPDLNIDPDEIRKKLKQGRVRMILITDYFGFLQPYRREIRQICDEQGICLVEDCAHSLLTEGAGEVGDFAIYSFRKILPVPDGGGLRINTKCEAVAPEFYPRICSNALSLTALAKSRLNIHTEMLSRARVAAHTNRVVPTVTAEKRNGRILPLSYFAQSGITKTSFNDVLKRRREDFQFWSQVSLGNPSLVPVFRELPPNVCPLGFPVKVKERASLEARARKAGFLLSVHWRLDKALGQDCSSSHELSKQILTLPVYPQLSRKHREILAGVLTGEAKPRA
jgi:hypothetical protein